MSHFEDILDTSHIAGAEEDKKKIIENERVEALHDHIDYAEKMKTWRENFQKVEQGLFDGPFDLFDKEIGMNLIGDSKSSFVMIENSSPLLPAMKKELLSLNYLERQGVGKTVFSKILESR